MAQRRVTVESEVGLHARPAALFVEAAAKGGGEVTVAKGEGTPVSAKSILAVMGLDVRKGDEIVISADGEDAEELLGRLVEIANAG
ncbi:HPr family phosphocarrier protein [Streptomonospora litoralis]|uniref:Phosphocarrier protein HPr n=1 Tax=Streptomonospora litoralis TaxID=2498135 RepID=A0A4V0ZJA1_9ACTN|nr:HPr family phosphocarrier protein [Streptomonospora litoralis]QBI52762.1 Phosphocarrier protein HPr [Streptomonospora litoralis]